MLGLGSSVRVRVRVSVGVRVRGARWGAKPFGNIIGKTGSE